MDIDQGLGAGSISKYIQPSNLSSALLQTYILTMFQTSMITTYKNK